MNKQKSVYCMAPVHIQEDLYLGQIDIYSHLKVSVLVCQVNRVDCWFFQGLL